MKELEEIYTRYYPTLRGIDSMIYSYLLQQGRGSRIEIAEYLGMPVSPHLIKRIEDLVGQDILIRYSAKPFLYKLKYLPMEE